MRRLAPSPKCGAGFQPVLITLPVGNRHLAVGGDDRDRTGNLRLAKPALSQLSYVPINRRLTPTGSPYREMGVLGFEPRTSALSELRSSQLSYTPGLIKQKSQTDFGLALSSIKLDRALFPRNGDDGGLNQHKGRLSALDSR